MSKIIDLIKAVTCDPEGNPCIGSDGDNKIIKDFIEVIEEAEELINNLRGIASHSNNCFVHIGKECSCLFDEITMKVDSFIGEYDL